MMPLNAMASQKHGVFLNDKWKAVMEVGRKGG